MNEWIGSAIALGVAVATRKLPVTMAVGIVVVWGLRNYLEELQMQKNVSLNTKISQIVSSRTRTPLVES